MTSFHVENCCHLVIEHEASGQGQFAIDSTFILVVKVSKFGMIHVLQLFLELYVLIYLYVLTFHFQSVNRQWFDNLISLPCHLTVAPSMSCFAISYSFFVVF